MEKQAREGLDSIFLTHGHFDHINDLIPIVSETGAKIVCQYDFTPWLIRNGIAEDKIVGFNKGGTVEVHHIAATMTAAQHSSTLVDGDDILPMGDAAGYVLRFSNNFAIYVTGDTCVTSDMQIMGDLYKPDLTILPIGDFFTMDPRQAAYALKLIGSPYAIGCHWGTFPILKGTPEKLKDACQAMGVNTEIIPLRPGESIS